MLAKLFKNYLVTVFREPNVINIVENWDHKSCRIYKNEFTVGMQRIVFIQLSYCILNKLTETSLFDTIKFSLQLQSRNLKMKSTQRAIRFIRRKSFQFIISVKPLTNKYGKVEAVIFAAKYIFSVFCEKPPFSYNSFILWFLIDHICTLFYHQSKLC